MMQLERHPIERLDHWRGDLQHVAGLARSASTRPTQAHDAIELARDALRYASVLSAFPEQRAEFDAAVREGAAASAAAFQIGRSDHLGATGTLVMPAHEPAFTTASTWSSRRVPIGSAKVTLSDWIHGFSLAVLADDEEALNLLCAADSLSIAVEPPEVMDTFWLPLCAAFATIARRIETAAAQLSDAQAELAGAQIVDRAFVLERIQPLIALALAVHNASQSAFDQALLGCLHAHREYWGGDERRERHQGFIAWEAAALATLGVARGLTINVQSPYLPSAVARAARRPPLQIEFACRSLIRDDEARWFLDLCGYPRRNRVHRVVEQDGLLLARYEVPASPDTPGARADFVLPDDEAADVANGIQPALDAGELVLLAEYFAGEDSTPASVSEAVACVDAALARLPANSQEFDASEFRSRLGRGAFEREPRRYTRARLSAYREGLAQGVQSADVAGQRAGALAYIEILKAQVMPVIEAASRARDAQAIQALRPRDADYDLVFADAASAAAARAVYEPLWNQVLKIDSPRPEQSRLHVHVAPAGMLASDNELSWHFPGGYRAIAQRLNPHRVWVCWKYTRAGETTGGMAYDGLVWCDDHWAWFPKPYRVLKQS